MLVAFLAGFSLGSYALRGVTDRSKKPHLLFAVLQAGIGLYGLLILTVFSQLPLLYGWTPFRPVQFFVCFAILIVPAMLMGATWPVVTQAYAETGRVGRDVGLLCSLNSLGCAVGPLAAGFLLIPLLGITLTGMVAAFTNLLLAAVFLLGGE
jgi:spermidine synthase